MKKITGCFLILLAAAMVYLGISALTENPETEAQALQAVWLGNDQYDPNNEGKLVVMLLEPGKLTPARDLDLDISFDTPGVSRQVDVFEEYRIGAYHWRELMQEEAAEGLENTGFLGENTDPKGLQPDPAFACMLPAGSEMGSLFCSEDHLKSQGFHSHYVLGRTYVTNASDSTFDSPEQMTEEEDPSGIYSQEIGKVRMHYRNRWPEGKTLAFLGIQKGQTLVPDLSLGMIPVSEDTESLEALVKGDSENLILGSAMFLIGALIPLFLGLKFLGIIKISRKGSQEEESQDF